ncbi:MAG: 4-hydroxy-3-methylbut-2-enyl diphosphate reductase [Candidatus Omnitrophica bacterium]|nr:4-hydroxy-3-methylbut-2-enyl diphosphate reductase [Candidatus Omnitrophota bacterium]
MQIFLARTQGFCAGVARAIDIVEKTLAKYGTPLYVFHEIVHNTAVVDGLKKRGVIFVDDLDDVPAGARVIFSAHGVSPQVVTKARDRGLQAIDATCPLVTKVHAEAIRLSVKNIDVILIGHKGHEEVVGTAGQVKPELLHMVQNAQDIEKLDIAPHKKVGFITQTTLSVDDTRELILKLRARFPHLVTLNKDDICYATQNRQDAVKELAELCEVIIICGSKNSSNSNRLREKGEQLGRPSYIIDNASELNLTWIDGKDKVGISSGASVPQHIVDEVVAAIRRRYPETEVKMFESPEKDIKFPLPKI